MKESIDRRNNAGDNRLAVYATCAFCHEPIASSTDYVRREWQSGPMKAPAFEYSHPVCFETRRTIRLTDPVPETALERLRRLS